MRGGMRGGRGKGIDNGNFDTMRGNTRGMDGPIGMREEMTEGMGEE